MWTYEKAKTFIESNSNSKLLTRESEFKNINSIVEILCECGKCTFRCKFRSLLKNNKFKCKICQKSSRPWMYEEVKYYIENIVGGKLITKESEFINTKRKIEILCPKCRETIFKITFSNFYHNKTFCEKCCAEKISKNLRTPIKDILNFFTNEGYEILKFLNNYKNAYSRVMIKCPFNHIYESTIRNFLKGRRCPICEMSSGEQIIRSYLENKSYIYNLQHWFDDCIDQKPLPFDFVVFNKDNSINCLIEFDGEQHYRCLLHWGGENGFELRKKHDQIKNKYCENKKIKLIRIPYFEINKINVIFDKEIIIN